MRSTNQVGANRVRATHTFRYTVQEEEEGSIQVPGMVGDDSNFISDEAGNKIEENIQSPLSVSGITVETPCSRSAQSTGFNGGDGSESSPYYDMYLRTARQDERQFNGPL